VANAAAAAIMESACRDSFMAPQFLRAYFEAQLPAAFHCLVGAILSPTIRSAAASVFR
jgi:hypothetical protein